MRSTIALLLMALAPLSQATPYFRPINFNDVHKVAGAFVDPADASNSSAGFAIALITHSVKDGCWLPSVVCEDWSPLMAGFAANGGRVQFALGPAANLTPIAKLGLLALLERATKPETLTGVKTLLGSQPISGPDVSVSFGPSLVLAPIEGGSLLPVNEWRGRFRIFAGAAMRF